MTCQTLSESGNAKLQDLLEQYALAHVNVELIIDANGDPSLWQGQIKFIEKQIKTMIDKTVGKHLLEYQKHQISSGGIWVSMV